jgi:hypothetical protein
MEVGSRLFRYCRLLIPDCQALAKKPEMGVFAEQISSPDLSDFVTLKRPDKALT